MSAVTRTIILSWGAAALMGASCSTQQSASATGPDVAIVSGDTSALQAQIQKLEAEARAMAKTTGCSSASACRTAPVGARPCGGPRTYIVYCAATTDSVALFKKLGELETVEKAYNKSAGIAGTCDFRMPPGVTAVGGSCKETSGAP
jgi:hypothetical protein